MPDDSRKPDDIEKILHDEKSLEDRKRALIDDLLKQRDAAMAAFDEKLEKLGYRGNSPKGKRSHHKKATVSAADTGVKAPGKAAEKPKA